MHISGQIVSWLDFPLILLLFFFELILSMDNAAVLSFFVMRLPENERKRALYVGILTSFILRGLVIVTASFLIELLWVRIVGGAYLIFLALKRFMTRSGVKKNLSQKKRHFWTTVILIELSDLLFAIDSILAALALTTIYYPFHMLPYKVWVIYVGGIMGVFFVRYIAAEVAHLVDFYPHLENAAYLLIGLMGIRLLIETSLVKHGDQTVPIILYIVFWIAALLIVLFGFLSTKWDKKV